MKRVSRLRPRSSRMRTWPYPFLGALSLSNDVDYCRFDFFEAFLRLCNTSGPTPLGEGLGLEVTSSLFAFSDPARQFGYFDGLAPDAPAGPLAARLGDYLRAGLVDASHAYGDFDGVGGFSRRHAERFFEMADGHGGDVRTFINHGDAHNAQCVGPGAPHHEGDRRGSPAYHADLLVARAPAFVTTSAHCVGSASEAPAPLGRRGLRALAGWRARVGGDAPDVLEDYALQDGSRVHAFWRLRGTGPNAPNLSSLNYQIGLVDLEALYAEEAAVVLYQHWGVLHREGGLCVPATVEAVRRRSGLLAGLRAIARERHEGRLWVAGLQRLLDYALAVATTDVVPGARPGEWELRGPAAARRGPAALAGLTLYVDPRLPARVTYDGLPLPFDRNGPDHTGRYSVTVERPPLPSVW